MKANPYTNKLYFSQFKNCICLSLTAFLFVCRKYILENMVYGFGCGLSSNKYACSSIHCEHTILNVFAIYQSLLHCIAMRQNAKAIIHVFPSEYTVAFLLLMFLFTVNNTMGICFRIKQNTFERFLCQCPTFARDRNICAKFYTPFIHLASRGKY